MALVLGVGCSAKSVTVFSAVHTTEIPQLGQVPLMSVDLHIQRAIEGICNMFEYVCIFMTLNILGFFPIVNLFSFEITSAVPEVCISSERLLSILN